MKIIRGREAKDDQEDAERRVGTHSRDSWMRPARDMPPISRYDLADCTANAIESAKSYLEMSSMSRADVIQQLSSKAGEGYKRKDAVFAVNHIKVNWHKEALQFAHQPDGLGDHERIAGNQSSSTRTSTSGRSPGG